jgi:endonuclease-3
VLSQHTSDVNSGRAYAQLVARFPSWAAVRDAPTEAVADAIRGGGLAQVKAERIQRILRELTARRDALRAQNGASQPSAGQTAADDELTLAELDGLSLEAAQDYLRTLPGVGPKTAACVLLFSLGRPAFPVDTHVWRVTRRLGLIGARVSADAAHTALLALIPPEWRHTMHVDLITHGRRVCHAQRPACQVCPLRAKCHYYWANVARDTEGAGA